MKVRAFAPANISCIFTVQKNKNPRLMGSTGLGFTIDKGVVVEVSKIPLNSSQIFFNNKKIKFPTIQTVIKTLTDEHVQIRISSELPLGFGFGLSGASALATAYAINKLFKLKKTKKELAILAHTAEVKNKTGLGDVVNEYFGGFCLKVRSSSQFKVVKIPLTGTSVYCRCFSPIQTKSILSNPKKIKLINLAGEKAIEKIQHLPKPIQFSDLINISKEFVEESRLLTDTKTKETIETIMKNKGYASMIILGNGVFSDKPFPGSIKFTISNNKAVVL